MPASTQETEPTLDHERAHLAESRAALRRMREHTAGLTAIGGDHVSTQHLKQALYRRMKALEDDPDGAALLRPAGLRRAPSAPSRTRPSTSAAGTSPARRAASRW